MARKRYAREEMIALRQVDELVAQGQPIADATRQIGVSEVTYRRWRPARAKLHREPTAAKLCVALFVELPKALATWTLVVYFVFWFDQLDWKLIFSKGKSRVLEDIFSDSDKGQFFIVANLLVVATWVL